MNENEEQYTIDQVIEASFDFSKYPEEEKQKMIAETSGMIMEASLLQALTKADESTQNAFQELIEGEPNEDQMGAFINKHFADFQEIVVSEIETFLNSEDSEVLPS